MANATERALRRKRKRDAVAVAKSNPIHRPDLKKRTNKKPRRNKVVKKNPNLVPLGDNALLEAKGLLREKNESSKKKKKKKKENENKEEEEGGEVAEVKDETFLLSTAPASQQLRYFLNRYQSACGFKLSSLELEPIQDKCMVELPQGDDQGVGNFCKHIKSSFKNSWKEVLSKGNMVEGEIAAGSPAILIVSASALRSLELLRGLKPLTRDCRPAKLFAKHMKLEEQITLLKSRVNIATGTPSRIKKLIELDALGLSRLALVVIDMQRDAKGFALFTLPQVSNEFWELYKCHLHQRLSQGDLKVCFYGPTSVLEFEKILKSDE